MKPEVDMVLVAAEEALLLTASVLDDEPQANENALSRELGFDFNVFE